MVPYRRVFELLEKHQVKYLIAGGFAVNFHQVQRATVDLDLLLQLDSENVLKFVAIMQQLGFCPRVPVVAGDLADSTKRAAWISDKGMMVLSFMNPSNPFEIIDVFVKEHKPFPELWNRRLSISAFGIELNVISKDDLIEMKLSAGRDKDLYDVQQLKQT